MKTTDRFKLIRAEGTYIVIENTPAPASIWKDGSNRKQSDAYVKNKNYKGGYNGLYTNLRPPTKEMGDVIVNALNKKYGKVSYLDKNDINENKQSTKLIDLIK